MKPIRRKLPPQITAYAATPLAWHESEDVAAWRDAAHGDEFLTIRGKVIKLPEGAASPIQIVISTCQIGDQGILQGYLDRFKAFEE